MILVPVFPVLRSLVQNVIIAQQIAQLCVRMIAAFKNSVMTLFLEQTPAQPKSANNVCEHVSTFKLVPNALFKVAVFQEIEIHCSVFWRFTAPKLSCWIGFIHRQKLAGLDKSGDKAGYVNREYTLRPTSRFLSLL